MLNYKSLKRICAVLALVAFMGTTAMTGTIEAATPPPQAITEISRLWGKDRSRITNHHKIDRSKITIGRDPAITTGQSLTTTEGRHHLPVAITSGEEHRKEIVIMMIMSPIAIQEIW